MYQDDGSMRALDQATAAQLIEREGEPTDSRIFHVGEVLKIKGGWFRVQSIKPNGLRLKAIRKPPEA